MSECEFGKSPYTDAVRSQPHTSKPARGSRGMHLSYEVGPLYRFGVFELEAQTGQLRRNGIKLKLQGQPYQVLLKLLEHAGQTVTREQLRSALWPGDTFVDFETGLNTTIRRL